MTFSVPESELEFQASRSGGPGGQHVNKSSTRIEVRWNVLETGILDDTERHRIMTRLSKRIDASGTIRVVSSRHRSQHQNREAAIRRLNQLIIDALEVPKVRRPTRTPRKAVESRLAAKRRRSETKKQRKPIKGDESE